MDVKDSFKIGGYFTFECVDSDGNIKWYDKTHNLVVNEGLQDILDVMFVSGTQDTTWFIGLTDDSPTPAAAHTLASHAGWTEFDEYTGDRQAYVPVRSSQTISNTASVAAFAITGAGGGVGGGFLAAGATGTSDVLFSVSALSGGNRTVASGDTVNVTYTVTSAAS